MDDRPYLVFVGRVEAGKGSEELLQFFTAYKQRNPGPLALVLISVRRRTGYPPPDIVYTGFVEDGVRTDGLAGALALAQPSFFESFSMVLTEAWAQGRPVVAQGRTEVLVGQVRRSGGGVWYSGYAEFEAAVDLLAGSPALADGLGRNGRRYAEREYGVGAPPHQVRGVARPGRRLRWRPGPPLTRPWWAEDAGPDPEATGKFRRCPVSTACGRNPTVP